MGKKNKENAYSDYMKMIMHSCTWEKLTEEEMETFIHASSIVKKALLGTYSNRFEQMQGYYAVFLSALGYSPTGWREEA